MRKASRFSRGVKHLQLIPVHIGKSVAGSSHDYSAAARSHGAKCEETLCFQGGHAAKARGRHCLPPDFVGDVAGGKYAGHRSCGGIWRHLDIARRFQLDLARDEVGCRRMTDCNEDTVGRHLAQASVLTFFSRTWVTLPGFSVPQISSIALSHTTLILGFLNRRSCRMRSARK